MREEKKALNDKRKGQKTPVIRGFVRPMSQQQIRPNGKAGMLFNTEAGEEMLYSDSDPFGSYTGITREGDNRPVQDVDDL
ncbi:MAG: hypothetical protein IJB65_06575 [Clostridia bacterium]|nr:hypothetical protein [Clostridia bacterium]